MSIAAAVVFSLLSAITFVATAGDPHAPINSVLFYGQKIFFFASAFYSLSLAVYSFARKGLSRQFRKLLMKRHVSFCILTIFCQTTATINML